MYKSLKSVLLWVLVLLAVNLVFYRYFTRFDLTQDKRYTLSPTTEKLLQDLEGDLHVTVFLDGELRTDIKRLQLAVKDMLNSYQAYSNGHLSFRFIDPFADDRKDNGNDIYKQLEETGLEPTSLKVLSEQGTSQKIIFPGALFRYNGKQIPLNFLATNSQMRSSAENINLSVQNLEYAFSSAIHQLMVDKKEKIAFITGHNELGGKQLIDIKNAFTHLYQVKEITLGESSLDSLIDYQTLILAKPRTAFSDSDLYKLDQYVMHGGNMLLLIDQTNADLDSMRTNTSMLATSLQLNLDNLLFAYGLRLNYELLEDLNCAPIPVMIQAGAQGDQQLMPWIYFPIIVPKGTHPIVQNLDPIRLEFSGTIDTLASDAAIKTILLTSSPYSNRSQTPAYLSLDAIQLAAQQARFRSGPLPVAVLAEGSFSSLFANRFVGAYDKSMDFKKSSEKAKLIVVADGDIIKNDISAIDGSYFPLGYDKYTRQTFANKTFILNCVDYLTSGGDLLSLRSKNVSIRLLDKQKVKTESVYWQLLNVAGPIVLVLVFGLIHYFVRKRKYNC